MLIFLWLLFGHFIADWALQNDFVANNKGKYWIIMLAHCMVWTGVLFMIMSWFGMATYWKILFLLAGHWIVDKHKTNHIKGVCSQSKEIEKWNMRLLYGDQAWHILQVIIVAIY